MRELSDPKLIRKELKGREKGWGKNSCGGNRGKKIKGWKMELE